MSQAMMTRSSAEHATIELLSAYLDQELSGDETRDLKAHLVDCDACHRRLDGLRRAAAGLKELQRFDPPVELENMVTRRIVLEGKATSWLDRLETMFSSLQRQSSVYTLFAVILALATIVVLFSQAVHRWQNEPAMISVLLNGDSKDGQVKLFIEAAGKRMYQTSDGWIEAGLDEETVPEEMISRVLIRGTAESKEFFAAHPELIELRDLPGRVLFQLEKSYSDDLNSEDASSEDASSEDASSENASSENTVIELRPE